MLKSHVQASRVTIVAHLTCSRGWTGLGLGAGTGTDWDWTTGTRLRAASCEYGYTRAHWPMATQKKLGRNAGHECGKCVAQDGEVELRGAAACLVSGRKREG